MMIMFDLIFAKEQHLSVTTPWIQGTTIRIPRWCWSLYLCSAERIILIPGAVSWTVGLMTSVWSADDVDILLILSLTSFSETNLIFNIISSSARGYHPLQHFVISALQWKVCWWDVHMLSCCTQLMSDCCLSSLSYDHMSELTPPPGAKDNSIGLISSASTKWSNFKHPSL